MSQPSFNAYGAVDLGALSQRSKPAAKPTAGGGSGAAGAPGAESTGGVVVDVTEATFEAEVVQRSMTVPVVIDFWATWCGPCKQLSPVLERLAADYGGRWVLAKVDVDANQRIAAAASVQSIPTVVAVVKGQPVPLFVGALPEAQVRQYLDELLRVAAANGVDGTVAGSAPADAEPAGADAGPAADPRYADAFAALEAGDLDRAAQAYRTVLADSPADPVARTGLAQVEIVRRAGSVDPRAVRRAAESRPDDVAAQTLAADVDLLDGRVEDAFGRLVEVVRRTSGADRDTARQHLLELFAAVGDDDPRVRKGRTALASALF